MTTTTTVLHSGNILYVAFELSQKQWRLGFGDGQHLRQVTVPGGNTEAVRVAIAQAKNKFGLPASATVKSCYEAGRDGFWLARWLGLERIENLVVESASIEVSRRARRAKTDRLDVQKLLAMLIRHWVGGERRHWSVVRVPSEEQENQRRWHRERERLMKERTGHRNRIWGLLQLHGVRLRKLSKTDWAVQKDWAGRALAVEMVAELQRESQRLEMVEEQIKVLERQQAQRLAAPQTAAEQKARKLMGLRGVGAESGWVLCQELLGWRKISNRRELGALAGLTGTPYSSGDSQRERGISKAGNRWVRWRLVELAWSWLRYQPKSELTQWYWRRFGYGSGRMRRVGIVAVARKLLVALWKYVERDEMPAGAVLKAV